RPDENVATSLLAATMSAYLVTDQNPEFGAASGCQQTGAWARSRADSACGTPRAHRSRSVRSAGAVMAVKLAPNQNSWQWTGSGCHTAGRRFTYAGDRVPPS